MNQFDFARNWRKAISPLLTKPAVVHALCMGMGLHDMSYRRGDPPWLLGRGLPDGKRPRKGSLAWYQPVGCCHYIAPFSWAIGKELFPDLKWGFITSDNHTVAIGYQDQWEQPELMMDILLFRKMTADESLAFAKSQGWRFYRSLHRYAASFCTDPEYALELLESIPA